MEPKAVNISKTGWQSIVDRFVKFILAVDTTRVQLARPVLARPEHGPVTSSAELHIIVIISMTIDSHELASSMRRSSESDINFASPPLLPTHQIIRPCFLSGETGSQLGKHVGRPPAASPPSRNRADR